jgi:hypothetical protein
VGFPLQSLVNAAGSILGGGDSPSKTAWEVFKSYFDDAKVIDIETSLAKYPSMVLTNVNTTRTNKTANVLRFTATAKKFKTVSTQTVAALKFPETPTAATKKAAGKKPPVAAKPPVNDSVLFSAASSILGL